MNTTTDLYQYDDEKSLQFIREYLPKELDEKFSDNEIYYAVELLYKYKGFGTRDEEYNEVENYILDEEVLVEYVAAQAKTERGLLFIPSEVIHILRGELMYDQSIGLTN